MPVRLLAPFDPIVWDRRRFELLWGWPYRFEAYTPVAKRKLGYYALPLLWRDRVDRLGQPGGRRWRADGQLRLRWRAAASAGERSSEALDAGTDEHSSLSCALQDRYVGRNFSSAAEIIMTRHLASALALMLLTCASPFGAITPDRRRRDSRRRAPLRGRARGARSRGGRRALHARRRSARLLRRMASRTRRARQRHDGLVGPHDRHAHRRRGDHPHDWPGRRDCRRPLRDQRRRDAADVVHLRAGPSARPVAHQRHPQHAPGPAAR